VDERGMVVEEILVVVRKEISVVVVVALELTQAAVVAVA